MLPPRLLRRWVKLYNIQKDYIMIRFLTGLFIVLGVAGNDCNGKCDPSMDLTTIVVLSAIGLGLMLWSLPKMLNR